MKHFKLAPVVVALCLVTSMPAHAQFGNFFQNLKNSLSGSTAKEPEIPTNAAVTPEQVKERATAFAEKTTGKMSNASSLKPMLERLYLEGERNATLNVQRIGLAALHIGELELAGKMFEVATNRIEMVYADNPEAQKAKSLWTAEKVKDYKGEPYERAMAHYYRGLVFAAKADFQNARAMFKQAEYQDTVAESEVYGSDFGLMPYMAGWASFCDGNAQLAKDYLSQAAKGDTTYEMVSVDKPLLVLFETGRAPKKIGAGQHKEALKFESYDLPVSRAVTACENTKSCPVSSFQQGADIGFQATTRGGRPFDTILNGKASFKEGADTVSKVADTVGAVGVNLAAQTGNSDAAMIGLVGMFAGLVAKEVSKATATQADIREWEQLPNLVWVGTGNNTSTAETLAVNLGSSTRQAKRLVNTNQCQLYLGRDSNVSVLNRVEGAIETGVHKRDPIFRREMEDLLNGGT
jgi:tetratricopeptide (TPR) repeat protein